MALPEILIAALTLILVSGVALWRFAHSKRLERHRILREQSEQQVEKILMTVSEDDPGALKLFSRVEFQDDLIDHLVVTARGVFCILIDERQPKNKPGGVTPSLIVQSDRLVFQTVEDADVLKRAHAKVQGLQNWLAGASGKSVGVAGVLVFPNWKIERKQPVGGLYIVSLGELKANLLRFQIADLTSEERTALCSIFQDKLV